MSHACQLLKHLPGNTSLLTTAGSDNGSKVALWISRQMAWHGSGTHLPASPLSLPTLLSRIYHFDYKAFANAFGFYYKASNISPVGFKILPIMKGTWTNQRRASRDCFFQTDLYSNKAKWK